jgi:hypothetical protein
MTLFRRVKQPDPKVRGRVLNRLRNTGDQELIRWIDNIHTGIGRDVSEMRKSLSSTSKDQAHIYIEDIRLGAVSLLAAMQALEERINPQQES